MYFAYGASKELAPYMERARRERAAVAAAIGRGVVAGVGGAVRMAFGDARAKDPAREGLKD